MPLKLISTELSGGTIQATYTDGQPADNAKRVVIYRQPFDGDAHKSLAWNQLRVISDLATWADEERRRLRNEIESHV